MSNDDNLLRQQNWRIRQRKAGFVQCGFWLPRARIPEFRALARVLRAHPHLMLGPLIDPDTGQLVEWRKPCT